MGMWNVFVPFIAQIFRRSKVVNPFFLSHALPDAVAFATTIVSTARDEQKARMPILILPHVIRFGGAE